MAIPTEKLYSQELLGMATELAQFPLKGNWDSIVEVRSKTCGSTLQLGISLNQHNELSNLGFSVSACAFGQAAGALFARSALGLTAKKCQQRFDKSLLFLGLSPRRAKADSMALFTQWERCTLKS